MKIENNITKIFDPAIKFLFEKRLIEKIFYDSIVNKIVAVAKGEISQDLSKFISLAKVVDRNDREIKPPQHFVKLLIDDLVKKNIFEIDTKKGTIVFKSWVKGQDNIQNLLRKIFSTYIPNEWNMAYKNANYKSEDADFGTILYYLYRVLMQS